MLNRRMPNGTYGGVRGERKNLPYSIQNRVNTGFVASLIFDKNPRNLLSHQVQISNFFPKLSKK